MARKAYLIIVVSLVLISLVGCDSNSTNSVSKTLKQEETKKNDNNAKERDNTEDKSKKDNTKGSKQDKETPERKEDMPDDEYLKYLKEIADNTGEIAENTRKKPKKIHAEEDIKYFHDISEDKDAEGKHTSEEINVNTNNDSKNEIDLDGMTNDLNN
ncbi:hypothetical protein [Metaclostridioides mangenotii]|uniref:hypothetical protein n=1 Tax=Metaclostridioides mangenotii TaxID=1540 RepID=UPI0026EB9943|nr:hypothetical protein [Clostridioides mangenotii]